jgi:hypothetical protein
MVASYVAPTADFAPSAAVDLTPTAVAVEQGLQRWESMSFGRVAILVYWLSPGSLQQKLMVNLLPSSLRQTLFVVEQELPKVGVNESVGSDSSSIGGLQFRSSSG